ncbi:MAG TPA: MFS transporter [Xanthobacteraceae bacterium]|jgi:MFS family permease|nr:MFS transporter [Xanthobacteraceae bacterium]
MTTKTQWRAVFVLVLAGIIGAFQVGKAAVAVPLLRRDLGLDLFSASLVLSLYATLAAATGLPAGAVVSRWGARKAVVAGLMLIGAASMAGAFAQNGTILLAARALESCGFLGLVVAAPTLIRALAAPRDRELALVCWSIYMPAGSAVMMLAGPSLMTFGWQGLWLVNGVLAAAYAFVVWYAVPRTPFEASAEAPSAPAGIVDVLSAPGPRLAAATFGIYTLQYFALTGLLPTLLVERLGLSVAQAGAIAAATVVANGLGNLFAGLALRLGIPLWAVVAAGFATLGLCAWGIFAGSLPLPVVAGLASITLAVTGLVPASIFAASPHLAPSAALHGTTLGLVMQASNLGQLLGPAVLGAWVQRWGWPSAPILFSAIALGGLVLAMRLRTLLRPT